ncbi:alpha/beta fold hydrolase [Roseateles sp. DAIF2]|uniref:alpha/beta fold hydrolase n=1 Tax=Roseateles sp. DAIF2 TaxID=2714952 RepID=UPI0018A32F96|nr:alpha/beta fold hydrolase [Roseateles sp. DAIF2]QPF71519.1 alpha/beta fold hydrolase [Roseateles sp. DAIF2]
MQIVANGITLEVEQHGPANGEPLLLIMGLGMQLVGWPDEFVEQLAAAGFRVIRFDNRDIGLSQGFDHLGVPHLGLSSLLHLLHLPVRSAYSLADMAEDARGLLDALGIERAHVCGASMGGMIAQHLAARHPQRVKSLTLMMTSSGSRRLPGPSMRVRSGLLARPPRDHAGLVAHSADFVRLIGSPAYPPPEGWIEARLDRAIRRSHRPRGLLRHLSAVAADADRTPLLSRIQAPTQVIHGSADPLVPVPAGRDLARRIPGARIDEIDGMGHDLPPGLWPRFVAGIGDAAARA